MALKDLLTDLNSYYQDYPLHAEFNYGAGTKASNGIFDQKSQKFGEGGTASDQPKGGFSNQPYIQVPIPIGDDNYNFLPLGGADTSNVLGIADSITDGFLRGGIVTATARSVADVLRLSKFGIDLVRGPEFIAKQVALQRSNVKFESEINPGSLNSVRTYNLGVNTLASVGSLITGIRFKRHGLFPQTPRGEEDPTGYYSIINKTESSKNRLITLKEKLLGNKPQDKKELYEYSGGPGSLYGIGNTKIFSYTNTLNSDNLKITYNEEGYTDTGRPSHTVEEGDIKYPITKDKLKIDPQFPDNPTSIVYTTKIDSDKLKITVDTGTQNKQIESDKEGNIKSNIKYPTSERISSIDIDYDQNSPYTKSNIDPTSINYTTRTQPTELLSGDEDYSVSKLYNYLSLDQPTSQQARTTPGSKSQISLNELKDFRRTKATLAKGDPILKARYALDSSNYGIGGNMESRLGIGTGFDKMGELPIIRTVRNINSETNNNTRDLIKFFIEAIDNDNPNVKDYIQFRAFLESFNENYSAKWKSYNFVGNPEPFYNYDSFDRGVSLSFKIAAFKKEELKPIYVRLNALISQLFPDYKSNSTRSRGPYIKLTVGSYLDRQPGFIESIGIKWDKDVPWEIGIEKSGGIADKNTSLQVLPHVLDIDMKFQPIHTFVPRKVKPEDSNVPFITLNDRNGNKEKSWIGQSGNFEYDKSYNEFAKEQEEKAAKEKIKQEKLAAEAKAAEEDTALKQAALEETAAKEKAAQEEKRQAQAEKDRKVAELKKEQAQIDAQIDSVVSTAKVGLGIINPSAGIIVSLF